MVMINGQEVDARELLARQHKKYGKRALRSLGGGAVYRESQRFPYASAAQKKKMQRLKKQREKDFVDGFDPNVKFF